MPVTTHMNDVMQWWTGPAQRSWAGADRSLGLSPAAQSLRVDIPSVTEDRAPLLATLARGAMSEQPIRYIDRRAAVHAIRGVDGHPDLEAVVLRATGGRGLREAGTYDLSVEVGLDAYFAPTALRTDGRAAMALVTGNTYRTEGIFDGHAMEFAQRGAWLAQHPGASADEAARGARVVRQALQSFDASFGQLDRTPSNAMRSAGPGTVNIDNEQVLSGGGAHPLTFTGPGWSPVAGTDLVSTSVLPEVAEMWGQADRTSVARHLARMLDTKPSMYHDDFHWQAQTSLRTQAGLHALEAIEELASFGRVSVRGDLPRAERDVLRDFAGREADLIGRSPD